MYRYRVRSVIVRQRCRLSSREFLHKEKAIVKKYKVPKMKTDVNILC